MADSSSLPLTTEALPDDGPDAPRYATCPMCHTPASMLRNAVEAGGAWRCVRCGQHWDAGRLAAVAAYAAWTVDRERVQRQGTDSRNAPAQDRDRPAEGQGGRT